VLKPIFQKQFKGAIYERWLTILQQFNLDLQYKPVEQMQMADALSRNHWDNPRDNKDQVVSPDEQPFQEVQVLWGHMIVAIYSGILIQILQLAVHLFYFHYVTDKAYNLFHVMMYMYLRRDELVNRI
jgi:alpha-acetolactate decarboxylase